MFYFVFFKQKTAYEMRISDWSSDVCSSDLVVFEVIGGADGPALILARQTLTAGKALVTANKAMIAHHGLGLAELAEKTDTPLKYEAAVAGGVPVIKAIREGASANEIARVYGILNGTCNYRSEEHTSELQSLMRISYA